LACRTDWDPDHPQNFLDRYVTTDAQALRNARPDTGLAASRVMYPPGNWTNGRPPAWETLSPAEQQRFLDFYQVAYRRWVDRRDDLTPDLGGETQ
jgi:hypothetical protein